MSKNKRDKLFSQPSEMIVDFVFDEQVVRVFPDMIRRSVPGYEAIITLLGLFAQEYAQADSHIYDLGCSTGAATLALRRRITVPNCRIIAVDNSVPMVESCQQSLQQDKSDIPVEVICADIQDINLTQASIIVLNFTLQFIAPELRADFIDKCYQGLKPGGVLILSEKVIFPDQQEQAFQEKLQLAFKKANGYSELEISQKRTALENVLIPNSVTEHRNRLLTAGFRQVHQWFAAFNFVSFAAIK